MFALEGRKRGFWNNAGPLSGLGAFPTLLISFYWNSSKWPLLTKLGGLSWGRLEVPGYRTRLYQLRVAWARQGERQWSGQCYE